MIMSNPAKKREESTDHQETGEAKISAGCAIRKGRMKNDVAKAEYGAAANGKLASAYGVAVADFLKAPEIISCLTIVFRSVIRLQKRVHCMAINFAGRPKKHINVSWNDSAVRRLPSY
jgi:hypothetical protein